MSTLIENVNRIQQAKSDIISSIESKGVEVPNNTKIDNLPDYIDSINELKGETKTVTPTTSQQTINPSSGKNGITQITVDAVTSSIDANIIAANIKKDIAILGVTGNYEGSGGSLQGYTLYVDSGSYPIPCVDSSGNFFDAQSLNTYNNVVAIQADTDNEGELIINNRYVYSNNNGMWIYLTQNSTAWLENCDICLIEGTKITLANGDEKNIEDITYDDDLLVWNFDEGKLDHSKPIWIKCNQKSKYYFINKYKSGKVLGSIGQSKTGWGHRVFSLHRNSFIYTTETVGSEVFTLDGADLTISCERIEGNIRYFNIITNKHFNHFSNRILTSCSLNNIYPFREFKFVKDGRPLRKLTDYKDIPQYLFDGLRLAENQGDSEILSSYVRNMMNNQLGKK